MFKIGDRIDYCFYQGIKIIDKDSIHYYLEDEKGNKKPVYIELVDKYGRLRTPDS
jgi:hypothetical protein